MALPLVRQHGNSVEASTRSPLAELDRLNRRLATLIDSWARHRELLGNGFAVAADVEETDSAYIVEIELPGVDRADVDIEVSDRRLCVRGERKDRQRTGIVHRRQRTFGRFTYEVVLPGSVRDDAADANIDAGVLTVRLPKPEPDHLAQRDRLTRDLTEIGPTG